MLVIGNGPFFFFISGGLKHFISFQVENLLKGGALNFTSPAGESLPIFAPASEDPRPPLGRRFCQFLNLQFQFESNGF